MRTTLAFGIALMISGPVLAEQTQARTSPSAPASPQRANVPRTTGTGLSGVPLAANTVMGMSPGAAALLGIVVVGGIVAIVANNNDDDACTPSGTGTGTGATGC